MNRLFIGLPIDEGIIDKLRAPLDRLTAFPRNIKTVSPENLHITLKFLGDTDETVGDALTKLLPEALKEIAPIPFKAAGFGAFPSLKNPSVIWCGLDTDLEILRRLQGIIEEISAGLGFPREKRKFSPHITLGRVRRGQKIPTDVFHYLQKNLHLEFGSGNFDRVVLFKSDLTPAGPRYSELLTCRLK